MDRKIVEPHAKTDDATRITNDMQDEVKKAEERASEQVAAAEIVAANARAEKAEAIAAASVAKEAQAVADRSGTNCMLNSFCERNRGLKQVVNFCEN